MKWVISALLALVLVSTALADAPAKYRVAFSTYLGGTSFDTVRDVAVDSRGNIVVVGGTSSTDFPVTPGAFQTALQKSTDADTASRQGDTDAYIAKFSPAGELIWCTYLGGPGYDRAYAVEVDRQDRVAVAGRAGPGFPTTPGAFQPRFIDTLSPTRAPAAVEYGKQNGFVACFTGDGARVWASYVWYGQLCRDVAVDDRGDIYLPSGWNGNVYAPNPPPPDLSGYKKQPSLPLVAGANHNGADGDSCLLKIKSDGSAILWGTWLCGSAEEELAATVRVDARHVYFLVSTASPDMPFNPADRGIHSHAPDKGDKDLWVGKVSADGNQLLYGTYIGGNSIDGMETHQLAVDDAGCAYTAIGTLSTDMPTTAGVLPPTFPAGPNDGQAYACKIGPDGALLLGTYLPSSEHQSVEGVSVDAAHNVYFTGTTHSRNPRTAGTPYQSALGEETSDYINPGVTAAGSGYFTVLAADFRSLVYSTCFGKGSCLLRYLPDGKMQHYNAYGGFHSSILAPDGSVVAVGSWLSDGLPLVNAGRSAFQGGPSTPPSTYVKHSDGTVIRFVPDGPLPPGQGR